MRTDHWTDSVATWRGALLFFLLFAAVACGLNLGGYGLMSMEPMIVDGARAMLESGNWAVPRLYGEVHTFKPALAYWLAATAQLVAERPSPLVARAPFALAGLALGFGLLILVGRRLGPRAGLFVGLAMVGTPLFLERVRLAEFDTPLALGVGLAVGAVAVGLSHRRDRLLYWCLAYLFLAVGFLAKGAPALMTFGPGLLLAAFATGTHRRLFGWRHLTGFLLGTAVIGAYVGWAYSLDGAAIFEQPVWEAGRRGLEWTPGTLVRTAAKPLLILAAFLPWSATFPLLLPALARADRPRRLLVRAGLGFLVGGTLAFLAVPTHEMRYYLPLGPSLAIVCGLAAESLLDHPAAARLITPLRALFAVLGVGIVVAAVVETSPWLPAGAAVIALLAVAAFLSREATGRRFATLMVVISLTVLVGQAWGVMEHRAESRDLAPVAAQLGPHLPSEATLWVVGPADPAGKHGSLYHQLQNRVRTLCGERPPREASYLLLVDGQLEALRPARPLEVVARAEARGYSFQLARLLPAGQSPRPATTAGTGRQPSQRPAVVAARSPRSVRCTIDDYRSSFPSPAR